VDICTSTGTKLCLMACDAEPAAVLAMATRHVDKVPSPYLGDPNGWSELHWRAPLREFERVTVLSASRLWYPPPLQDIAYA
jgi:hypothetical protein